MQASWKFFQVEFILGQRSVEVGKDGGMGSGFIKPKDTVEVVNTGKVATEGLYHTTRLMRRPAGSDSNSRPLPPNSGSLYCPYMEETRLLQPYSGNLVTNSELKW